MKENIMPFYDELVSGTRAERETFLSTPLIQRALAGSITRPLYLSYLSQAYHHVKHTCNLLALAASRCGPDDRRYQHALFEYIGEERGHEQWILDDIAALGGNAVSVAAEHPGTACSAMVGYAYYAIEHLSPYAMLGMVHVLEGISVGLAQSAADSISAAIGQPVESGGFRYLISHGALDQDHVAFFAELVNGITEADARATIVETARIMYGLFGGIFVEIDTAAAEEKANAA